MHPVAILAGEGSMPLKILEGIQASGRTVLLLSIHQITDPKLASLADHVSYLHVTQLGKAIRACLKWQATELIMAGRVHHRNLFLHSIWKLDWCSFKVLWKLKDKRANSLLKAIVDAFAGAGITVMSSVAYLKKYLASEGVLTRKAPSRQVMQDAVLGVRMAKELGRLDIGQTVVIKNQAVIAVEAMEGTDLCLERAGQIAGPGCVVVKMPKPNQDMRFDVPVIGVNTIQKVAKIGAKAIVIESGRTLIIDAETIAEADRLGIIVIALPQEVTEQLKQGSST